MFGLDQETIMGLVFFGVIYFVPAINAASSHHRNASAVFLLNLFLGWTLVGWVLALVWSQMKEKT